MIAYVLVIILVAFAFDFVNGFHDSANSIATVVGTRVLSPFKAVLWAALFNFVAAFTTGTMVAKAVGSGFIDVKVLDPNVVFGALLGAIAWNLITWVYGIPSSSSHALIGGITGAGLAKAGTSAVTWGHKWTETLAAIVVSPMLGATMGFLLMVAVYWIFRRAAASRVDRFFRGAQLASSGFLSLAHGSNDAQKTMGIIMALLVATQDMFARETGILSHLYVRNFDHVPYWIELGAYTMISLGTLFGGWRIVHTMGSRITRLRPVGGFCAETGGALVIYMASHFGIPVSTTHTITGSIVGVGATNRLSAVRWGIAGRIVWAWVVTIPAAGGMAAISYLILRSIIKF
ncbi:MAG TPA: inorganic phosphate transporter [Longimicrobium sp.]|nr:inorganic phosphate transporter [Longimicrobium sp.]HSU13245.1 inorganic phosphate transporter [Longimicrobium sp.]